MAFNLPLPGINEFSIPRQMNALNELQRQKLENQYYGPNIESQIGQRNALTEGQNITNKYLPDKLRLANAFAEMENKYYGPKTEANINNLNATTRKINTMTPLEAEQMRLANQFYPEATRANINAQNAMANYRNAGGAGLGTGAKEQLFYQNSVAKDNPHLKTPEQIYEAANVLANGGNQLSDGTPLNPLSPASRSSLDRVVKGTTTSPILTGNIRANQAEAELGVLNDYAQKGLKPYGDTILGYSPAQVLDSFKSDEKSQKQLGKFIASQALQYESAQNRVRLANGQPGVTTTEELIKLSGQMVKTNYPKLSYVARQEAARYLDEALKEGLKARQSIGIGASETRGNKQTENKTKPTMRYNQQTGELEEI